MAELAYAIKWTWLDYWRWGYAIDCVNFNMNREVWRRMHATR